MIIAFLLLWLILSAAVGAAASSRGRNGIGWFFISLSLSPIIALLLLIAFPVVSLTEGLEFNDAELRKNIKRGRRASRF
jgi:hypothetical protein